MSIAVHCSNIFQALSKSTSMLSVSPYLCPFEERLRPNRLVTGNLKHHHNQKDFPNLGNATLEQLQYGLSKGEHNENIVAHTRLTVWKGFSRVLILSRCVAFLKPLVEREHMKDD
jgi:hypothetical protein